MNGGMAMLWSSGAVASDPVAVVLGEPQCAIRALGDAVRATVVGLASDVEFRQRELGDMPPRGDLPKSVAAVFYKPEVPVGSGGNVLMTGQSAEEAAGYLELGDVPLGGDPSDPAVVVLGEPQCAIRAFGDAVRATACTRQ